MNGADSDSGTCFECGYAFAKGKKIIAVRTDFRAGESGGLNAMLSYSVNLIEYFGKKDSDLIISEIDELAAQIIEKINEK